MIFKIIALLFLVLGLVKDYNRDKKQHEKAKVAHAVALVFLMYFFAGSFGSLGWLIGNYEKFQSRFYVPLGIFSADFHFISTFIHLGLSLIIILLTYNMIKRDDSSRKKLIKLIPFIIPTETLSFYRGFQSDEPFMNDYLVLTLGLIIMGSINLGLSYLYSRPFMIDFFKSETIEKALVEVVE
jgi:hypothetical protein